MKFSYTAIALLAVAIACKPHPKPAADSVTVIDTLDSVGTDSQLTDQGEPEFPPEPDITPQDTVITAQDSALRDSVLRHGPRTAPSSQGRAFGLSTIPQDSWCTGTMNITIVAGNPNTIAGAIRKAAFCGIQLAWTTPRPMMTTNGESKGPRSLPKAKAAIDKIAAVVNPLAAQYASTIAYWSLLDDWLCAPCWGGETWTIPEIVELVQYAHQKVDSRIPLGLRGEPKFLRGANFGGATSRLVTTSQWHSKKGPRSLTGVAKQRAWYTEQAGYAHDLGIQRQIYAVNVGDLDGGEGEDWASPTELGLYEGVAITFDPADAPSCGSLSWRWDRIHEQSAYKSVLGSLANLAKQQVRRRCG